MCVWTVKEHLISPDRQGREETSIVVNKLTLEITPNPLGMDADGRDGRGVEGRKYVWGKSKGRTLVDFVRTLNSFVTLRSGRLRGMIPFLTSVSPTSLLGS